MVANQLRCVHSVHSCRALPKGWLHHEGLVASSRARGWGVDPLLSVPDGSSSWPPPPPQELHGTCEGKGEPALFVCTWDGSLLPGDSFLIFFYFLRKVQKSLPRSLLTVPSTWQRATHPGSTPPCPSCASTSRCSSPPLPSSCLPALWGLICRQFISSTLLPNYFSRFIFFMLLQLSSKFWCLMKMSQGLSLIWQVHFIGFDNLSKKHASVLLFLPIVSG